MHRDGFGEHICQRREALCLGLVYFIHVWDEQTDKVTIDFAAAKDPFFQVFGVTLWVNAVWR